MNTTPWMGRRCKIHKNLLPLSPGDVLLPAKERFGKNWYLNPGSAAIPKEGTPQSYMTLADGTFRWKELTGQEYDALDGAEM